MSSSKAVKVFCIGFHKTGTTSLADALTILGYRVTGPDGVHDPDIAEKLHEIVMHKSEVYDAFQDNPWPLVYKEMDEMWPGSKFILTLRDANKWLNSQVKHFGTKTTPMRKYIYGEDAGCPVGNESHYLETFNRHITDVRAYFADRPDDLLELDLSDGDSWDKICPFLGVDTPEEPFPHSNKATDRENQSSGVLSKFKRLFK